MTTQRTYLATYHPGDINGTPVDNQTGVLPTIRVEAADAESAIRIASALTGSPVSSVERLEDDATPELVENLAPAEPEPTFRPTFAGIALMLALAASSVGAQTTVCVKDNKPGDCFVLQPIPGAHDTPPAAQPSQPGQPAAPAATPASASPISNSGAPAATAAANIGGDTVRSTVAVFPAPSAAPVPVASGCIVTRSTSAGLGWNLLQGARSEQHSDPVCVLQWLASTATDPTEAAKLRALVLKTLGAQ